MEPWTAQMANSTIDAQSLNPSDTITSSTTIETHEIVVTKPNVQVQDRNAFAAEIVMMRSIRGQSTNPVVTLRFQSGQDTQEYKFRLVRVMALCLHVKQSLIDADIEVESNISLIFKIAVDDLANIPLVIEYINLYRDMGDWKKLTRSIERIDNLITLFEIEKIGQALGMVFLVRNMQTFMKRTHHRKRNTSMSELKDLQYLLENTSGDHWMAAILVASMAKSKQAGNLGDEQEIIEILKQHPRLFEKFLQYRDMYRAMAKTDKAIAKKGAIWNGVTWMD